MSNSPSMVITDPIQMCHLALENAGIPINGVGTVNAGEKIPSDWQIVTCTNGLTVHIDYRSEATQIQIAQGNDIVMNLDVTPRQVRTVWDIYSDIANLSQSQLLAIKNDLMADGGAKIKSIGPPQDGSMLILDWASTVGTPDQQNDVYMRMAALYTQQNVSYLEQPEFDPTINVSGWKFIPGL